MKQNIANNIADIQILREREKEIIKNTPRNKFRFTPTRMLIYNKEEKTKRKIQQKLKHKLPHIYMK